MMAQDLKKHFPDIRRTRAGRFLAPLLVAALLAGCATAPEGVEIWDPYEEQNRAVHAENRAIDAMVLRRGAASFEESVPAPVRASIANLSDNLSLPGQALNGLLQGRPETVVENTFRFLLNSTLGVGGLFDPASEFGLAGRPTDFGETLHVWGAPEGAYVELPFLGPSTQRDAFGRLVDVVIDPVRYVLPVRERNLTYGVHLLARVGDRGRYSAFFDATLYESADSYAQARLMYLQNRRFLLGDESRTQFIDPYEDLYGD